MQGVARLSVVLGIAGCSGSGKTTLARELACELDATLVTLDLFYRDLSHLPPAERAVQNFDHPDSLEHALLVAQVAALAAGHAVDAPQYDFATHTRATGTVRLKPAPVLIVEGILALHYSELRSLLTCGVFVAAPHEVCLRRRIYRDVEERGRTEASVCEQFWATAHPMAERYVLPSAAHATLTVDGTASLDWSVEQVLSLLHRGRHG